MQPLEPHPPSLPAPIARHASCAGRMAAAEAPLTTLHIGERLESTEVLLVLLHGSGALAADLAPLAKTLLSSRSQQFCLEQTKRTTVLLPEGPVSQGLGKSWWEERSNDEPCSLDRWRPPITIIQRVVATVRQVLAQCQRQPVLVLGGFSLGSAVAAEASSALVMEGILVVGLVVLSGILCVDAILRVAESACESGRRVLGLFVALGEKDTLVLADAVREGIQAVRDAGAQATCGVAITTCVHEGGHEVGSGSADRLSSWLQDLATCSQKLVVVAAGSGGQQQPRRRSGFTAALQQKLGSASDRAQGDALTKPDATCDRALVNIATSSRDASARASLPQGRQQTAEMDAAELEKLRGMEIEPVYDHPQLLDLMWGSQALKLPGGAKQAQFGGVTCAVYGRKAASSSSTTIAGPPTVLLFPGHSEALCGTSLEQVVEAYADQFGAAVVVPACSRKLSECFASARTVASAIPEAFGPGPLLVHGMNTGSALAIQVAAEFARPSMVPRAWLLILDNAPPALTHIPGVRGMVGCMSVDPLLQQAKLKVTRCRTLLVRGFEGDLPMHAGGAEPVDSLAAACVGPTQVLRRASILATSDLPPNFCEEAALCLGGALADAEAHASDSWWVVDAASCLVREGSGLATKDVGRLLKGALLRVAECHGLRLRVCKLRGEGPAEGWVSFVVAGKIILCRAPEGQT